MSRRDRRSGKAIDRKETLAAYIALRDRKQAESDELNARLAAQRPEPRQTDRSVRVLHVEPTVAPVLSKWNHKSNYEKYINSAMWLGRKKRYFSTHPRRCRVCRVGARTDDQIHLHHLSYERMGNEPDGDLMPLCQVHHAEVHKYHRRIGGTLRDATARYVATRDRPQKRVRTGEAVVANGRTQPC